jgi:hypothetical protein
VYSLGIVAYEMISGHRPFDAENPMDALTQRLTRDPRPLGSAASEVPPDLALAIDRCLQRDVTKRWPDAKSLREALQPSDEESEDSLPGRFLRLSVTLASLAVLAFGYLSVYSALNPNFRLPLRGIGVLVGPLVPAVIFAVAAVIGLRSHGLDGRSIIRKAFHQPSWWRSWYPQALRRRGDVWSRLPHELRRFRLHRGILQIYALGIFLPLQLMSMAGLHLLAVPLVGALIALVGGALLLAKRRRAEKFVRETVGATIAEASAILTTPTWAVSTWRRRPIASLLTGQRRMPLRAREATVLNDPTATERPTQL